LKFADVDVKSKCVSVHRVDVFWTVGVSKKLVIKKRSYVSCIDGDCGNQLRDHVLTESIFDNRRQMAFLASGRHAPFTGYNGSLIIACYCEDWHKKKRTFSTVTGHQILRCVEAFEFPLHILIVATVDRD
jgi:hypothetical protein